MHNPHTIFLCLKHFNCWITFSLKSNFGATTIVELSDHFRFHSLIFVPGQRRESSKNILSAYLAKFQCQCQNSELKSVKVKTEKEKTGKKPNESHRVKSVTNPRKPFRRFFPFFRFHELLSAVQLVREKLPNMPELVVCIRHNISHPILMKWLFRFDRFYTFSFSSL